MTKETAPKAGGHKPTLAQRKYLERGLDQAGGKLPLFDDQGQRIDARTVQSCLAAGWAEPWFANPLKPDWLVCRLTGAGRAVLAPDANKLPKLKRKRGAAPVLVPAN